MGYPNNFFAKGMPYAILAILNSRYFYPCVRTLDVLAHITKKIKKLQQGMLTKTTKSRLEELESIEEDLETRISIEQLSKLKISKEYIEFWLLHFRKLDIKEIEHERMLFDTFVNSIYLYDDRILISFNHNDTNSIIKFDEAKSLFTKAIPR